MILCADARRQFHVKENINPLVIKRHITAGRNKETVHYTKRGKQRACFRVPLRSHPLPRHGGQNVSKNQPHHGLADALITPVPNMHVSFRRRCGRGTWLV